MTKTHKAVLSTLAVLCLLFMGSGVAQAQECFAFQSGANTVRAEGITEAVGSIQLQCRDQRRLWRAAHWQGSRNQHYAEHRDHQ